MRTRKSRFARAVALLVPLVAAPAGAAEGDLDPMFHGDGRFLTDFGLFGDFSVADVHEAPDGRLVVSGTRRPEGSAPPRFFWQAIGEIPATTDERCELVPLGVEGAIVGKALYAGQFTLAEALDVAGH